MTLTEYCKHVRTILVAKDDREEYRDCLDCGQIFEATEGEPAVERVQNFGESLSDA